MSSSAEELEDIWSTLLQTGEILEQTPPKEGVGVAETLLNMCLTTLVIRELQIKIMKYH